MCWGGGGRSAAPRGSVGRLPCPGAVVPGQESMLRRHQAAGGVGRGGPQRSWASIRAAGFGIMSFRAAGFGTTCPQLSSQGVV